MEQSLTMGEIIVISSFLITTGGLLWRLAAVTSAMKEKLKSLSIRMTDVEKVNDTQDSAIQRVEARPMM